MIGKINFTLVAFVNKKGAFNNVVTRKIRKCLIEIRPEKWTVLKNEGIFKCS